MAGASQAMAAPAKTATGGGGKAGPADARFRALYKSEWAWRVKERLERDAEDTQLSDRQSDVTPAAQARRLAKWEEVRRQLDSIPEAQLSADERVNYQVYKDQIDVLISKQRFKEYEKPFNSDSSFWSGLGYTASRRFHGADDYNRYISYLADVPRYFADQTANMKAGLARGFTPPKATLVGREKSISIVADAKRAEDTTLWKPFTAFPSSVSTADQAKLKAQGKAVIEGKVIPAYQALFAFVTGAYIPGCAENLAAEAQPDGKAYYRAQIREFVTLDMDPEAIHQLGLAEVAKIHAEMLKVMKETGFAGDFPAFLQFLRTDPRFYPKTPEELLNKAAWIAKKMDGRISQYFGWLPRERFGIEPVAPDIAPFYTSARGGNAIYWVNTYDLPSRPLYNLTALTLHESSPGHALQGELASEADLPDFRREVYISAYGEGWALYCEKLGVEMGMYETPYDVFGMWTFQMWRACRLVVDTGVHHKGWSRAQAIQYLHDNTALADHDIEIEVDRYISWPGQALSYYLGMMAIWEVRAKAEKALGPKFDIRAFHDTVLSTASVPIPVLKARIDQFIAEGGRDPRPVKWQKKKPAAKAD
jgi:uncharacterized protein (DUF885 family)